MGNPIEPIQTADEIDAYLAFANPIIGVDMNDPYMRRLYGTDNLVREIAEERRAGFMIRDGGTIVAGSFAKILRVGDKFDRRIDDPRTLVLTEYWAVAETRRRQGLISSLIPRCESFARGCLASGLVAEIELANPASLHVAFGHGFVATHLLGASLAIPGDFLILRKDL